MAERKFVEVEEEKKETKKSGLNIDLSELKKIGAAILAFIASNPEIVSKLLNKPAFIASNPEIVSKLLNKPATYLKKIVNGENVSSATKKKVNKTINDSKSGGLTSILTSLTSLSGGDAETNDLFGKISNTVKGAKVAESAGVDVGGLLGGLLGSSSKTKTKKTSKKSKSSSDGITSLLKGLFK